MFLFNKDEIAEFRRRVQKDRRIIELLKNQVKPALEREIAVPDEGISNWAHYYYCPTHSIRLRFDLDNPHAHICPVDGEVLAGEPYDSTWRSLMNRANYKWALELALLYLLTEDTSCAERSKNILFEYSKRYSGYAAHGNIPYNGPGKAEPQTLNEAVFLRTFAYATDLLEDYLSEDTDTFIKENMLLPGGEFLMKHRINQLHNHEVFVNSAIAVLGLYTGSDKLIKFAVCEPYGLKYQLEHGVLSDAFWFEGSINCHLVALESFMSFEKFAHFTKHAGLDIPKYIDMFRFVFSFLTPKKELPLLNDSSRLNLNEYELFEFAYKLCRDSQLTATVNYTYQSKERNSVEGFFFLVETLPLQEGPLNLRNYHNADGSGITVLRGEEERYLLIKHSPYGGEHDHYDRLALSFSALGSKLCSDFGTTGYGAQYHYEYYKNTGTHNTVMINEFNQAPANGEVFSYKEYADRIELECGVRWSANFKMPDSFTICDWSNDSYSGVEFRRKIIWCGKYFIEAFNVSNVKNHSIDWVLHVAGELKADFIETVSVAEFSDKKPFKYLHDVKKLAVSGVVEHSFKIDNGHFNLFSLVDEHIIYRALGPDCPSINDVNYIINRKIGESALFINVFEAFAETPEIKNVEVERADTGVLVKVNNKSFKIQF